MLKKHDLKRYIVFEDLF